MWIVKILFLYVSFNNCSISCIFFMLDINRLIINVYTSINQLSIFFLILLFISETLKNFYQLYSISNVT